MSRDHDEQDPEDGGQIAASDELTAALEAAEASVEQHERASVASADAHSPDKVTIELLSGELQSLKEEYEYRGKEIEESNEKNLRLQAEFDNFRRRKLKEHQEALQYGHQNVVKDLLMSVDNLDRAIEHSEQSGNADFEGLLRGVELVRRELLAALGKHGVGVIEAEGQPFDPSLHEAMGQVPDGSVAPNTVLQVLQKGYRLHDRMLRPARVMVARAPTPEEAGQGQGRGTGRPGR